LLTEGLRDGLSLREVDLLILLDGLSLYDGLMLALGDKLALADLLTLAEGLCDALALGLTEGEMLGKFNTPGPITI